MIPNVCIQSNLINGGGPWIVILAASLGETPRYINKKEGNKLKLPQLSTLSDCTSLIYISNMWCRLFFPQYTAAKSCPPFGLEVNRTRGHFQVIKRVWSTLEFRRPFTPAKWSELLEETCPCACILKGGMERVTYTLDLDTLANQRMRNSTWRFVAVVI